MPVAKIEVRKHRLASFDIRVYDGSRDAMNPTERVQIGKTPLKLTRLGLGTAPLGGLFRATEEGQAIEKP
jgi:hypothetical protein